MKKIFNSDKGFTIIEMLMYMGLLSILLIIMVDLLAASLDIQLESQATSSVDQDGKFIINRLVNDIHRAQTIAYPSLGATQSGTLQLIIDGENYTYSTNSGSFVIASGSASDSLNSFNTTAPSVFFKRFGNSGGKNALQVTIIIKSKTSKTSGTETKTMQTTVGLR